MYKGDDLDQKRKVRKAITQIFNSIAQNEWQQTLRSRRSDFKSALMWQENTVMVKRFLEFLKVYYF